MKRSSVILIVIGGAVGLVAVYMAVKSKQPIAATGGQPINALPARQYALNPNYNPQAQPPTPTFTPFSGVPIVESLLSGFGSSRSVNQALSSNDSQPTSFDTTDTSSTAVSDSGTSTFFG